MRYLKPFSEHNNCYHRTDINAIRYVMSIQKIYYVKTMVNKTDETIVEGLGFARFNGLKINTYAWAGKVYRIARL